MWIIFSEWIAKIKTKVSLSALNGYRRGSFLWYDSEFCFWAFFFFSTHRTRPSDIRLDPTSCYLVAALPFQGSWMKLRFVMFLLLWSNVWFRFCGLTSAFSATTLFFLFHFHWSQLFGCWNIVSWCCPSLFPVFFQAAAVFPLPLSLKSNSQRNNDNLT